VSTRPSSNGLYPSAWLIFLISALVSLWKVVARPVVNTDGVLYFIAAENILESGMSASFAVYQWPFFQMLLAAFHWLSGLPLLYSAHLLMSLCFALLVVAFCRIVRLMGGDNRTVFFAFLVIICHTVINDLRPIIIRDPGMLAFLLLALSEQIRFAITPRWRYAIRWGIYVLIALLFRVEAFAIATLAPFAMLTLVRHALRERILLALKLYTLPALAGILGALAAAVFSVNELGEFKLFHDLGFMLQQSLHLAGGFSERARIIEEQILLEFSAKDATWAMMGMAFAITLVNVLRAITLPYVLALLGILCRPFTMEIDPRARNIIIFNALIITSYLFSFSLFAHFNLDRYCLQFAVLALLPLPFALAHWWQRAAALFPVRALIVLLFTASALDSLISSDYKKVYIRDAASWARENSAIAAGSLRSNEPYIGYFSTKEPRDAVLTTINPARLDPQDTSRAHWLSGTVYAQRVRDGADLKLLHEDIANAQGAILKEFPGGDGRSVVVFTAGRDTPRSELFVESRS